MVPPPLLKVEVPFKFRSPVMLIFPEGRVIVDPLFVVTFEKLIVPVPPIVVVPPKETMPVPPKNVPPLFTVQLDPFMVRLLDPEENVPPDKRTFPLIVIPLLARETVPLLATVRLFKAVAVVGNSRPVLPDPV
jgi:hypothetical protein